MPTLSGEVGATRPLAVLVPQRQQPGAPALRGHSGPLRRYDRGRRIGKVAQHLPAHCRIGIEQPFQDGHRAQVKVAGLRDASLGKIDETSVRWE